MRAFAFLLIFILVLPSPGLAAPKKTVEEIRKVTDPIGKAVSKTADAAMEGAEDVVREAHTLGGKFLQGLINVMIAASPGKTRVYLPAPSSDPNSGVTVGVLPVFLFVDEKENIRHILAPSLTHNRTFSVNGTMRYYWYPKKTAQLFTLASYAVETNRRFAFRFEDPALFTDWIYFKFDYNLLRDGSFRFYGLGADSPFEKRANYTLKDNHIQIHAGLNFLEYFRFVATHRVRMTNVVDGPIDSLPKISGFTPRPAGVEDPKTTIAQRFTLSFNSRDLVMAPVQGYYASIFGEHAGPLGGDSRFERVGTDLRGFHPYRNARFVTAWRFVMEGENGDNTPFYEMSLLGGKDSLRGFGEARFVGRNKISFSLEERIRVYTLKAFNVNIDFEVAPFYEVGTAYQRMKNLKLDDLHHVGGVGFRPVVRPNVVGIIDLGFSEQGTALFVGIDYPF